MSFGILRTNVGLTTNVKIMVGSNYQLSIDSIESNNKLSLSRFKKFKFNESSLYDEIIPIFYKNVPVENSYYIKYDNDSNLMSDSFREQFDDLYNFGAKNISNNKDYSEEFEYFAPLYFDTNIPKNFIIFRIDGSGIEELNSSNFINNIINKLKIIKVFDLTNETPIGKWLDKNFTKNDYFPKSPLDIDFRNLEFSRWNGIDYETGGYTSKSFFMDNILEDEKEIFELEKFLFNNFKSNKLVFPNIINLSFLFNDIPANSETIKKWSLNRYYGFYLDDLELKHSISPYKTPELKDDVIVLDNNILFSNTDPNNPFKEDWSDDKPFYIEYKNEYFLVEKYTEPRSDEIKQIQDDGFINEEYQRVILSFYKIISSVNLSGKSTADLNKNSGKIENNKLIFDSLDTLNEILDDYNTADVWLIEIDGIYHNILKQDNSIEINSDYEFKFNENSYEYKIASVSKTINTEVDFEQQPNLFKIFRCKFTDIKDFDTRIVDTEFSKFEYEKKDELTITDETKMYLDDLSSTTNPKSIDDFIFKNSVVNIPVSSEYTSNFETFKVENQKLSDIWHINPVYCRWIFKNSLSANDYPYLLNNSNVFEFFNRTVNPFEVLPSRIERNLDYFYTINSSTSSYVHHSLHVENVIDGEIDTNFKFDEEKYLNIGYDYDYFSFFFERKNEFDKSRIKKNIKKYSLFNGGDSSTPNITLFRGIEFRVYDVESIQLNRNNDIESINLSNSNDFDNYKFSILLTDNKDNNMEWDVIDYWKMDKNYASGSTVVFEDILYTSIEDNSTINPSSLLDTKSAPYNLNSWTYSNIDSLGISQSILWSPIEEYNKYDYVYNLGEYYFTSLTSSNIDFWNPIIAQKNGGYLTSSVVLFKGDYWQSMTSSNIYPPDYLLNKTPTREFQEFENNVIKEPLYWKKINKPLNTKWEKINIWNPSSIYNVNNGEKLLIFHKNTIWSTNQSLSLGLEPGIDLNWKREYSIIPDTDYIYKENDNPIIELNNRYYIIKDNPNNKTLENGITIYINKKWKNILVNIRFNDNTLPNLSNTDRDKLYEDIYTKLTAYNFIISINEFYNKYNFTDYVNYVIIEENGDIQRYSFDNNIRQLPYIIGCYPPDEFTVRFSALSKSGFTPNININNKLNNGNIDNISKLNWYNNIPISYLIQENEFKEKPVINYSNLVNPVTKIFRFTGQYEPLFYDIQLFDKNTENRLTGNYKFDTSLTEFGLIKELKFRKVNRKGSLLKLKDSTTDTSIYPMINEFGYSFSDFMIFKSNWDFKYHIETKDLVNQIVIDTGDDLIEIPQTIGQSQTFKIQNSKKYNL